MPVDTTNQLGMAAAELYRMVSGTDLDGGERAVLAEMLQQDDLGKWSHRRYRIAGEPPYDDRRILEARVLAGAFLLDEHRIVWSTYLARSLDDAFHRIRGLIDGAEALRLQVKRTSAARGNECIDLNGGRRIDFVLRQSPKALRGMTFDCHLLGEAGLDRTPLDETLAQLLPGMASKPNGQLVVSFA